jgi:molecular chaperone GrpE
MTTPWSSQEPSAFAAGESEQDSPAEAQFDAAAEDPAFDASVSGKEAIQRATAAAAYGKAVNNAPAPESAEQGAESIDPESQVQADIEQLSAKAELADEYLLIAQRTQADFENYRKRAARDAALAQDRGVAKLAKELLPAIDNLERAVQAACAYASAPAGADAASVDPATIAGGAASGSADAGLAGDAQIVDGLKLVHAEVLAALGRAGIEPFSPIGEQFDPQHHEAVAQNRVEGTAPGTVIEVYQQGYRLGETILRPARVLVAA